MISALVHLLVCIWIGLFLSIGFPTWNGHLEFFSVWHIEDTGSKVLLVLLHLVLLGMVISHYIHEEKNNQ